MEVAIRNDNAPLLKTLLEEEPQRLHQRDQYGETPLITAVYTPKRSLACIRTLLRAGADVGARNRWGFTALHVVIWNEYFELSSTTSEAIINLLLDSGADLEDDQNSYGCTPLMTAVLEDHYSNARLLLSRGANPNKVFPATTSLTSSAGTTLLSHAWLHPEMMRTLLEGGADVTLRNAKGQTALEEIQALDAGDDEPQKQQCLHLLRQAQSSRGES